MRLLILVLFAFTSPFCSGQTADFNNVATNYLRKLQKSELPGFFTACNTAGGKAFLIVGFGSSRGMLFEMEKDEVVNAAPVTFKRGQVELNFQQTQGGIYTYTVMQNHAIDMSNQPFTLTAPQHLEGILMSVPSQTCVDRSKSK